MKKLVVVEEYDANWVNQFQEIKATIWPWVSGLAISIEHVGSTSVVGLAAKPTIDIDLIIEDQSGLSAIIEKLSEIGYEHLGDMGIIDREAFRASQPIYRHNLYVCSQDSISLKNHLCLRDSLRLDSKLRDEYALLKKSLAAKFPNSIENYVEGKTNFILKILQNSGYSHENLEAIRTANLASSKPVR